MAARLGLLVLHLTDASQSTVAFNAQSARQPTRFSSELFGVFGAKGRGAFGVLDHAMPFWRLASWDQMHGAIANEITTTNFLKRFPQGRPVIGVVVSQKCLV
jgi:hypothetical protein